MSDEDKYVKWFTEVAHRNLDMVATWQGNHFSNFASVFFNFVCFKNTPIIMKNVNAILKFVRFFDYIAIKKKYESTDRHK